jgi:hypothetical protein
MKGGRMADMMEIARRKNERKEAANAADTPPHPATPIRPNSLFEQAARPGTQSPSQTHDDRYQRLMLSYQEMTGNRATRRDWVALAEVRQLGETIIREGIRLSVVRAPSPIKSFRNCLGAIWEVATRDGARRGIVEVTE